MSPFDLSPHCIAMRLSGLHGQFYCMKIIYLYVGRELCITKFEGATSVTCS